MNASSAVFAPQSKSIATKKQAAPHLATKPSRAAVFVFRTTVGDFALRNAAPGYQLEVRVGKMRRQLGLYQIPDAAILALRNRTSGHALWDMMGRNAVAIQIDTVERWERAPQ